MIFQDQSVRIVIATKPVDFRKGHDGLASMAQAALGFAPKAGVMVVFRSKRGDRVKVLFWDGSGTVVSGAPPPPSARSSDLRLDYPCSFHGRREWESIVSTIWSP